MILRGCRFVLTQNDGQEILEDVDIMIEGKFIAAVGKDLAAKDDEVIDCSNAVVMPGLVNAHTHAAMTFLRGYKDDLELMDWLNEIWKVEAKLTPEVVYLGSKLAIYEMLSTGTTAFIDMYFYPEETAKAARELGMRAKLGPPILGLEIDLNEVKREILSFFNKYSHDELVKPLINVHSVYACPLEALDLARELSEDKGIDVHIHVSETRKEVFECKKKHKVYPVELLDKRGFLSRRTQLVHLGWVTSWEINMISKRGAKTTHCPTSNMKLATAGTFPFMEMIKRAITVSIGTDGAASNNCLNMFREMKNAVLLQRNNYWNTDVKATHVMSAATVRGYEVFGVKAGRIRPGYLADLVVVDLDNPTLQPVRRDNLLSNIVYSATGAEVRMTIINGKVVYDRQRRDEMIEEVRRVGEKLNEFIEEAR